MTPIDKKNDQPLFDWREFLRENGFYLAVLLFLIVFPHLVGWLTGQGPFGFERRGRLFYGGESIFWMSVLIEIFALSILVMSYNLMFGFTGVISFGHALFFGLGGYVLGMLLQLTDIDPVVGLLLGTVLVIIITGLVSFVMGLASLRLRGIYFAIFTLAVAESVWIFFGRFDLTNGEDGLTINNIPAWIDPARNRLAFYYIALALFVFVFVFIRRLIHSPTGTVFKAIRENEERAQTIGYHTLRYKLLAITLAGIFAGLAGIIHGILNKAARPEMLNVAVTVDALLMTIIGGVGTFVGPIVGASGLHLADTIFRDSELVFGETVIDVGDSWNLILGVIFVLVVLVFPFGIVGTIKKGWYTLRQRQFAVGKKQADPNQEQVAPAGD